MPIPPIPAYNFAAVGKAMDAVTLVYTELLQTVGECSFINTVAFISLFYCSFEVLKAIIYTPFKLYLLAQVLPGVDITKLGRWAVVTGGTDGIGK